MTPKLFPPLKSFSFVSSPEFSWCEAEGLLEFLSEVIAVIESAVECDIADFILAGDEQLLNVLQADFEQVFDRGASKGVVKMAPEATL